MLQLPLGAPLDVRDVEAVVTLLRATRTFATDLVPVAAWKPWITRNIRRTAFARISLGSGTPHANTAGGFSDEEIAAIVQAIRVGLRMDGSDVLLDLACGNGALSSHLFGDCSAFVGVDYSEYLIDVAREFFQQEPLFRFVVADADVYMLGETDPGRFTRFLCYWSLAYFSAETTRTVLTELHDRFTNVAIAYLGNLPDRDLAHRYYAEGADFAGVLDDPEAQIGIWRTEEQMRLLAWECGWESRFETPRRLRSVLTPATATTPSSRGNEGRGAHRRTDTVRRVPHQDVEDRQVGSERERTGLVNERWHVEEQQLDPPPSEVRVVEQGSSPRQG